VKLTRQDLLRLPLICVLSTAGAYISALAFIVVLQWSLPKTDQAYGQGVIATLRDPFVQDVGMFWANASALLVALISFFALRGRNLFACFAIVLACVVTQIVVVTPLMGGTALLGTFPVMGMALLWCRRSKAKLYQPRSA
jgi:hypothetical protein